MVWRLALVIKSFGYRGKKDNIFRGSRRDGQPLTFDHTVRSMAAAVDLTTQKEIVEHRIDFDNSDLATVALYSPSGNMVYFSTLGSSVIWAVGADNKANRHSIDSMGEAPIALALNAKGNYLYVHNFISRSVTVFKSTEQEIGLGDTLVAKQIKVVAKEKLAENVYQGKRLFYDSRSPVVSQEGYMSCASCHFDGSHDGRIWDLTNMGEGFRNTIDLRGRAGLAHGPLHWSANFDEVHDFELQIKALNLGEGLIDEDFFNEKADPADGIKKSELSNELDNLSDFVSSLSEYPRSPNRAANGEMTTEALKGKQHFIKLKCYQCHGGEHFTDSTLGLNHNVGTIGSNTGNRLGKALTGLDTPTLIGLWQTAPYLHDGSASSIEQAINKHQNMASLTAIKKQELIAYLQQLEFGDGITIQELGIDNQLPKFAQDKYQFKIVQKEKGNSYVGQIKATDADGDKLSYYLVAGKDAGVFSIENDTGKLFYRGIDIYKKKQFNVDVKVLEENQYSPNNVVNVAVDVTPIPPKPVEKLLSAKYNGTDLELTWPTAKYANIYYLFVGTDKNNLKRVKKMSRRAKDMKKKTVSTSVKFASKQAQIYLKITALNQPEKDDFGENKHIFTINKD